jgi:hypothetical protein
MKRIGMGCLGIVVVLIVFVVVASLTQKPGGSTSAVSGSSSSGSNNSVATSGRVGQPLSSGNWTYLVDDVKKQKTLDWSKTWHPTAKGTFVIVAMTVTNTGKENFGLNSWDFELKDSGGVTYKPETSTEASLAMKELGFPVIGLGTTDKVPPGVPVKTSVIFDINPAASALKLNLVQAKSVIDLGQ